MIMKKGFGNSVQFRGYFIEIENMGDKKVLNCELYDYMFKILFFGDVGVGKISLMWRFFEDVFKRIYIFIIGIDFKLCMIEMEGKCV